MDLSKIICVAVIIAFLAILVYIIKTFNAFKLQAQEVESQKSGIEVALTTRYDTLVKLNKTVCGYTKHESGVLENVTKLRRGMSTEELSEAEAKMSDAYSGLLALSENYPDLKASANFIQLQETIYDIENTLQAARRIYNEEVRIYNSMIDSFPSCFVAPLANATRTAYFEAEAHKRNDVELAF